MASNKQFLWWVLITLLLIILVNNHMAKTSTKNTVENPHHPEEKYSKKIEIRSPLERCLMLAVYDPPLKAADAKKEWESLFCRDSFRAIDVHLKLEGFLPDEYIKALEKVPKFKKNESALNEFLCRVDPHNNYRGIPCPGLD